MPDPDVSARPVHSELDVFSGPSSHPSQKIVSLGNYNLQFVMVVHLIVAARRGINHLLCGVLCLFHLALLRGCRSLVLHSLALALLALARIGIFAVHGLPGRHIDHVTTIVFDKCSKVFHSPSATVINGGVLLPCRIELDGGEP